MKVEETWIELHDLCLWGRHGVSPSERKVGSDFLLNLRLKVGVSAAAFERDDLEGTVSYADVFKVVQSEFERPSRLLENLAWRMSRAVLAAFPAVEVVEISAAKVNPPIRTDCNAAVVRITAVRDEKKDTDLVKRTVK